LKKYITFYGLKSISKEYGVPYCGHFLKEKDFQEVADQSIAVGKLLSGLIRATKNYSTKI
jgi:hypothetical protein